MSVVTQTKGTGQIDTTVVEDLDGITTIRGGGQQRGLPGMPHEVFNIGDEPLIAFVARSAADEWDKIINYPSEYRPENP